jgi:pyruvate kinase
MLLAGMEVARLNFSHGTNAEKATLIKRLRSIEREVKLPLGILQDLQGPKLRVGTFVQERIELERGRSVVITGTPCVGTAERFSVTYPRLARDVRPGDSILLADGAILLSVRARSADGVVCDVVHGGELSAHKGMNVPGARLSIPSVTAKDRTDIAFGVRAGVDWIALSFVRTAADVHALRRIIARACVRNGGTVLAPKIVAKIEKPEALDNLDAIIDAADAIMVARGDLGVEIRPEFVPGVQKEMLRRATARGKPAIVATQMLESMQHAPTPTRAEASDVANAVWDGADAVMLSGETAVGKYPAEALTYLDAITRASEACRAYAAPQHGGGADVSNALAAHAVALATQTKAACLVVFTRTGATAALVARHRAMMPVLALCTSTEACRQLTLYWNLQPYLIGECRTRPAMIDAAVRQAHAAGVAKTGDCIVILGGSDPTLARANWVDFVRMPRSRARRSTQS